MQALWEMKGSKNEKWLEKEKSFIFRRISCSAGTETQDGNWSVSLTDPQWELNVVITFYVFLTSHMFLV